uniref:Clusterin N-terminal domain-containing protein n=1 Tax=Calidris pygmaea TaxID=425635 RepID=A0A8C3JNR1_9CHAR
MSWGDLATQEVCNETMLALWEECKPCLKHTCMRFYSRTCHSGSGLVGRQLEEFLNHSSPFSIWVNGERIDSLLERDQRQERQFEDLEERFGLLEDGVDDIFQDSTQVYGRLYPFFRPPFGGFREAFRPPVQHVRLSQRGGRVSRDLHPFFQHPYHGFHHLFQPFFEMTQRMLEEAQGGWEHPLGGFATGRVVPPPHPGGLDMERGEMELRCGEELVWWEGGESLAQVAPRSCGCPIPGGVEGQVGGGLEQPGVVGGVPAQGRGWHWGGFKVPSHPNHSVILLPAPCDPNPHPAPSLQPVIPPPPSTKQPPPGGVCSPLKHSATPPSRCQDRPSVPTARSGCTSCL